MLKYIGKRLLLMIPVILGISLIVFALLDLSPGDAAEIILGAKATPGALSKLRAEMGLDQPFWIRYFRYIGAALRGDSWLLLAHEAVGDRRDPGEASPDADAGGRSHVPDGTHGPADRGDLRSEAVLAVGQLDHWWARC